MSFVSGEAHRYRVRRVFLDCLRKFKERWCRPMVRAANTSIVCQGQVSGVELIQYFLFRREFVRVGHIFAALLSSLRALSGVKQKLVGRGNIIIAG